MAINRTVSAGACKARARSPLMGLPRPEYRLAGVVLGGQVFAVVGSVASRCDDGSPAGSNVRVRVAGAGVLDLRAP